MAIGDSMINTTTNNTTPLTMPAAPLTDPTMPRQPGKFGRIFGAIAGSALNLVAPGAGSLIGGFIGGGGMNYGSMDAMLRQQQQQSMMLMSIQNRVQNQTQEFTTVTNLLKAKHDGEMSAVHNFKS